MSNIPEGLQYSKDHEWLRVEGAIGTVGITDYAQNALGEVVYVELPRVGETVTANEVIGSVESVKAASELFTPVSGEVIEINEALLPPRDETAKVNSDPYGEAWMLRIKLSNPGEVDKLYGAVEYEGFLKEKAAEDSE